MKVILYIALFQTLVTFFFVYLARQRGVFCSLIKWMILIPFIQVVIEILFLEFDAGQLMQWDFMFPTNLLVPVLLYFAYRNVEPGSEFTRKNLFHLIPFGLFLLYSLWSVFTFLNSGNGEAIRTYTSILFPVIVLSFLLYPSYIMYAIRHLDIPKRSLYKMNAGLIGKLSVIVLLTGIVVGYFYLKNDLFAINIAGYIYITLLYLLILYYIYKRGRLQSVAKEDDGQKYIRSSLDSSEMDAILIKLDKFMTREKAFLDDKLNLDDLAGKVSLPKHHLSQALNVQRDKNFNTYVNDYRIEEFTKLIRRHPHYKLEVLARQCGFSSKSTFNRALKNRMGVTPSQYLKAQKMK